MVEVIVQWQEVQITTYLQGDILILQGGRNLALLQHAIRHIKQLTMTRQI